MSAWNAMTYEGKDTILRVVREEAERMFAMAEAPGAWEAPTACSEWQVRDIIGHIVDTTEGYFKSFETARAGGSADAHGLPVMHELAGDGGRAFRSVPQAEMMGRIRADLDKMMGILEPLTAEEWGGLMVPHAYMGPVPAVHLRRRPADGLRRALVGHPGGHRDRRTPCPPTRPTCWCRSCSSSGSTPSGPAPTSARSPLASRSAGATRTATGSASPTRECPTSRAR